MGLGLGLPGQGSPAPQDPQLVPKGHLMLPGLSPTPQVGFGAQPRGCLGGWGLKTRHVQLVLGLRSRDRVLVWGFKPWVVWQGWVSNMAWGVWFGGSKTSSMGWFRGSEAGVEWCVFQALKGARGCSGGAENQARLAGFRVKNGLKFCIFKYLTTETESCVFQTGTYARGSCFRGTKPWLI